MSRLDNVIEQVKDARKGDGRPWIFDNNGNIKDDVLVCDVLPLLENLREYEIEISNLEIDKYLENKDYLSADNTYNWSCNISNDLNWNIFERENNQTNIAIIMVHLYGDIRGGYSNQFVISIGNCETFLEFLANENLTDETIGYKELNDDYIADYDMFSEEIMVYRNDGDYVGTFYEIEKEELLEDVIETDVLLKNLIKKGE